MTKGIDHFDIRERILCIPCIEGKQHKQKFPKEGPPRAPKILGLVHNDICGTMHIGTHSGCKYFITFIDDLSRYSFVYLLRNKSEAFDKFVHYKNFVEKQTNHKIKILRSDRGGEYMSDEFKNFCTKEGIKKEFTTSYTPQQNGVSERKNRTLVGAILAMLSHARLSKTFWGEALLTANYLQNRSPTKAILVNKTPFELWFGRQPNLFYLKVFGSKAHVLVQKETRKKLDSHSIETIFLGYSEESKAYQLMNINNQKIIISRDVIFEENIQITQNVDLNNAAEQLIDLNLLSIPKNPQVNLPPYEQPSSSQSVTPY